MARICECCGAPFDGAVCEYCGTSGLRRKACGSTPDADGDRLVIPFLADRSDVLRFFYHDLEHSRIKYDDPETVPATQLLFESLRSVRAEAYYAPFVWFEGEFNGQQIACAIPDASSDFNTPKEFSAVTAINRSEAAPYDDAAPWLEDAYRVLAPEAETPSEKCFDALIERCGLPRGSVVHLREKLRWRIYYAPLWLLTFKLGSMPYSFAVSGTTGRLTDNDNNTLREAAVKAYEVRLAEYVADKQAEYERFRRRGGLGCASFATVLLLAVVIWIFKGFVSPTGCAIVGAVIFALVYNVSKGPKQLDEDELEENFNRELAEKIPGIMDAYYQRTYGRTR